MARVSVRSLSSLAGLVLIALVAAALVIGVVVFVKNRGDEARHDQSVQIAAEDEKASGQTTTPSQASNSSSNSSSDSASTSTTTATNTSTAAQTSQSASQLPTTGPSDQLAQVLTVGALAFSVSFYVASRRARRAVSL